MIETLLSNLAKKFSWLRKWVTRHAQSEEEFLQILRDENGTSVTAQVYDTGLRETESASVHSIINVILAIEFVGTTRSGAKVISTVYIDKTVENTESILHKLNNPTKALLAYEAARLALEDFRKELPHLQTILLDEREEPFTAEKLERLENDVRKLTA